MTTPLQIGFIPLIDAAALITAVEKGFTAAEGLDVKLVREVSWSNVRDKLNIGLFDAAHVLAPVPIASSLGLGHIKVPIVVPMTLKPQRQRHYRVCGAACGDHGRDRRRSLRSDGDRKSAVAGRRQATARAAASLSPSA